MANIITTALVWSQEDAARYFLQPLFISNNDLDWFDVMTNISGSSILLDKYSSMKGMTSASTAACFVADAATSTNTNVTLSLDRLEVNHAQQAFALFNTIKSQLMRTGVERNNLDGTLLMQIISELLMGGIKRDFSTILWWGATAGGAGVQGISNGIWEASDGIPAAQQVLYTGIALTDLANLMDARTNELAGSEQRMYVSRSFADQYRKELVAIGVNNAYMDLQSGIENLSYNGIPMHVKMDFDVNIEEFGASLPGNGPSGVTKTQCAFLVARDAIAIGTDWEIQDVEMWYDQNCKENRFRMNYSFGCALKDNSLVATITY